MNAKNLLVGFTNGYLAIATLPAIGGNKGDENEGGMCEVFGRLNTGGEGGRVCEVERVEVR